MSTMQTTRRPTSGRASAVALAFAVTTAVALLPAQAAGAENASITGKVVDGTNGGVVPDVQVTLHTFSDGVEAPATSDTTDRNGRFAFSTLVAGAGRSYQLSVPFDGAVYRSRGVELGGGEAIDLTVKVFETTTDIDDVVVQDWIVWIDRDEADGERIAVQQDLRIRNDGRMSYVGTQPIDDAQQVTIELPIADGAANFQYLGRFIECCAAVRDGVFVHTLPIQPGTSDGTVRYTAPTPEELVFSARQPTENFSLLVPSDMAIEASGLTAAGTTDSQGVTYRIYSTAGLALGDRIEVSVVTPGSDGARTLIAIGAGLLLVVLIGGGAMWWLRAGARRRPAARTVRRAGERTARANGQRRTATNGHAKGRNGRPRARNRSGSVENESLVVDEIVALDVAHERGLLEDETYRRLRAAAKDRLLALREER